MPSSRSVPWTGASTRTVALSPDIKAPDHYVYRDITGKRARGIGASGGLAGALIGAMIGAGSEGPGFKRFDAAASKHPVDIRDLVRRHMEAALKTSPMKLVTANADTTLKIEIGAYGIGPVNNRQLGAVITAKLTLLGRDGKVIWKKDEWATSNTTTSLENLEANPGLWPRMANEAAESLARKLILFTQESKRTAVEPLM